MRPDAHTLVAAYAADALDGDERADVEEHLAQCQVCREDVRGFRETLAVLADATAEAPPARMREAVLARARRTPQLPPLTPDDGPRAAAGADAQAADRPTTGAQVTGAQVTGDQPTGDQPTGDQPTGDQPTGDQVAGDRLTGAGATGVQAAGGRSGAVPAQPRAGTSRTLLALAAGVLSLVALGAGVWAVTSADRLGDLQAQQATVQRVLAADDVVTVSGTPQLSGGLQGDEVVVLASESADAALLLPGGLPEAPEGSTWQAWTVTGQDAVSAGVFDVTGDEAVALSGGVTGVDAVAVSLEPSGGSEAPTTDPVLVVPLA